MEAIKAVSDFKKFIELNRERLYTNAINASDISSDDEWMRDNQWDEIFKNEEKKHGEL